eukprot:3711328-Rhodomonas_salina.3
MSGTDLRVRRYQAAVLQELTCLRRLGLADNHLKDKGAVLLGRDVLPRLSVLSDLDLAGNSAAPLRFDTTASHLCDTKCFAGTDNGSESGAIEGTNPGHTGLAKGAENGRGGPEKGTELGEY